MSQYQTVALSEIVKTAAELKTVEEKVDYLKRHDSEALRSLLVVTYDPKRYKWNIPSDVGPPPYTPSKITESQGMLYRQVRKLRYLIQGFDGERLSPQRREYLFKEILETVDADDARLMEQVLAQKPIKGLTKKVIADAFPTLFAE